MGKTQTGMKSRQGLALCALLLTSHPGEPPQDDRRRNNGQRQQPNQWQGRREDRILTLPPGPRSIYSDGPDVPLNAQGTGGHNIFTVYNSAVGNSDRPSRLNGQNIYPASYPYRAASQNQHQHQHQHQYQHQHQHQNQQQHQHQHQPQQLQPHPSFLSVPPTTNSWTTTNSNNRGGYQRAANGLQNTADWQQLLNTNPAAGNSPSNLSWSPNDAIDQGNWLDVTNMAGTQMPQLQNLANFNWSDNANGNINGRAWNSSENGRRTYPATQILQFNADNNAFFSGNGNNGSNSYGNNSVNNGSNGYGNNSGNSGNNGSNGYGSNSGNWYPNGSRGWFPSINGNTGNWPQTTTRPAIMGSSNSNNHWGHFQSANLPPVSPGSLPSTNHSVLPGNHPGSHYPNNGAMGNDNSGQQMPGSSTGSSPSSSSYGNMYR